MATWTDGPEYAPVVRPEVFVAPEASPLPEAPPEPAATPGPGLPPADFAAAADSVALDTLAAPVAESRDPHEPFDVASTPLTSWAPPTELPAAAPLPGIPAPSAPASRPAPPVMGPAGYPVPASTGAWGAAHVPGAPVAGHGWTPTAPYPGAPSSAVTWTPSAPYPPAPQQPPSQPGAWPAPAAPHTWPPPAAPGSWPPPTAPEQVTPRDVLRAISPGVLICLAVGALVAPLSLPLLWVAQALATRVTYLRLQIARWFGIASALVVAMGLFGMLTGAGGFDIIAWYEACLVWARLANLVLGFVLYFSVAAAMRRGDGPDPR